LIEAGNDLLRQGFQSGLLVLNLGDGNIKGQQ